MMFFPEYEFNQYDINEANRLADLEMQRIRDFIILHYCSNQREHGELWRYCRNMRLPETLQHKIDLFKHRGHIAQYELESFEAASWLSIFDGMKLHPSYQQATNKDINDEQLLRSLNSIKSTIHRYAESAPQHDEFIRRHCKSESNQSA